MSTREIVVTYNQELYEVATLERAKALTVTPERGTTTEERWVKETDYLVQDIGEFLKIGPEDTVLDYGCGTGRVSKALIDAFGCRVVGVDAAKMMRLHAPEYVCSERFTVWSPALLEKMSAQGFRFNKAICLWVLQHVRSPEQTIGLIAGSLSSEGDLYLLNSDTRCVPTTEHGYVNDGVNVRELIAGHLMELSEKRLPESVTTPSLSAGTGIYHYRKS